MSIFDEINDFADGVKAAKRKAYKELPPETWLDDDNPEWFIIAVPGEGGTRSTFSGETSRTARVIKRPTEFLALMAAACLWSYDDELPYTDPLPMRREKYCGWCELRLPLHAFSPDKRTSDGLHSYCKECRSELRRMKWNRGK